MSDYDRWAHGIKVAKATRIDLQDEIEFLEDSAGGVNTWLELTDTPGAFTGQAGKYSKVNVSETALEFGTPSGAGDVVGPASSVDSRIVLFDGVTGKLIKDSGILTSDLAPSNAIYLVKTAHADLSAERATELRVVTPGTGSDIQTQINDLPT